MERIAANLYNALCLVVGTREQVYIRQRMYSVNDTILNATNNGNNKSIYSGSKAEGLCLPGSDVDLMFVIKQLIIKPSQYNCEDLDNSDLILDSNSVKPGFVKLKVKQMERTLDRLACIKTALTPTTENEVYLSSLLFRDLVVGTISSHFLAHITEPHGPCASSKFGNIEYDNMICLSYQVWPVEATEWIHRQRINNWPSQKLVEEIASDGCLLVPIGNPLSEESHMEWRISFSLAEKKLIHSMNHTQILCYGLLKLYLKHVIDTIEDCNGLLCSYFLKTALFYCIEEEHIVWEQPNLLNCFWSCFKRLFYWVRQGYCPSFFIKNNNMFESKIYGRHREQLTENLFNLYQIGTETLMRIPALSNLLIDQMPELFLRPVASVTEFLSDREFWGSFQMENVNETDIMKELEFIKKTEVQTELCPVDRVILRQFLGLNHVFLAQYLYKDIVRSRISNLSKCNQVSQLSRYILNTCTGHDICTGLLQYATLHYLTGKYKRVVSVLERLLSKFKCYVLYNRNYTESMEEYTEHMCGKGYSIEHKAKSALARPYPCLTSCYFYPKEIENEVKQNTLADLSVLTYIPPQVYCYVLLFLTYHNTGERELRNQTLDKLCESTNSTHFVADDERTLVSAILERCVQIATESP